MPIPPHVLEQVLACTPLDEVQKIIVATDQLDRMRASGQLPPAPKPRTARQRGGRHRK